MIRTQYDEEVRPSGDPLSQTAETETETQQSEVAAPVDLSSPIEYDAEPIKVPVKWRRSKADPFRYFILTESGDAVIKFRNACLKATRFGPDGKPFMADGLADSEAILVQGCLQETDSNFVPLKSPTLSLAFVRDLPTQLLADLFGRAKLINHVNDRGQDRDPALGKGSPSGTTAGSGR